MTSQLKVPVVVRKDYTIFLERFADRTWGHADVYRSSPGVIRAFAADLRMLAGLQGEPILATHRPEDALHAKFLRLTDATYLTTIEDVHGKPLEVHQYSEF